MNKEELTQKNGALLDQVTSLHARDNELRDRFSKVLGAPREHWTGITNIQRTYSWEEIFFED